jgi:hypothetical protein
MLVKGKDRLGTAPYIGIFGSMPCVARTLSRSSVGFKRDLTQICPAPSPDMSDLSALSRVTPAISDFLAGF